MKIYGNDSQFNHHHYQENTISKSKATEMVEVISSLIDRLTGKEAIVVSSFSFSLLLQIQNPN